MEIFTVKLMVWLTGPDGFFHCPHRYLSPMRPGHRVLPPESPATPSSQASSQPAGQTPRLPKSNSLSLFYKKCKTLFTCLFSVMTNIRVSLDYSKP